LTAKTVAGANSQLTCAERSAINRSSSARNTTHLLRGASVGADFATALSAVLKQTLNHQLRDLGLERCLAGWRRTNQKI
jgi:hypothetical protein